MSFPNWFEVATLVTSFAFFAAACGLYAAQQAPAGERFRAAPIG